MTANPTPRTPLYWLGFVLVVAGTVTVIHYVLRQLDQSGTGQTYYGFIGGGLVFAVIGAIIVVRSRRNRQIP